MSNTNDFFISRGVLMKYTGSDVHVIVPDKVKMIDSYAFQIPKTSFLYSYRTV